MAKIKKVKEEAKFIPRSYEDTFDMSVEELETLASQIASDLVEGETDKEEWLAERAIDIKAYFGIKKQSDWPFKNAAHISSKAHQTMVDTTVGNLVASALAPENIIAAGTLKSQSLDNAKYTGDFHNQLARFEYHFPDLIDRAWHTAFIESYIVLHPFYQWETLETTHTIKRWLPEGYSTEGIKYDSVTDTITDANGAVIPSLDIERIPDDPEDLKGKGLHECVIEVTTEHAKEGIKVLALNGANVFVPLSAPGETPFEKYQRASFVIRDEHKTIQEMKILQEQQNIKNFDLVGGVLSDRVTTQQIQSIKEEQAGYFDITKGERHLTRNLWWYGKWEYKGKFRELVVYMNAETGIIMKVQINQFGIRPFFPQIPFPIEGTTGGESLPKRIRQLVTELELAVNTLINAGLIKAYPPKFYDPLGGLDPKNLGPIGPNAYVPVRDPSKNVFMPPQPEDPRILFEMVKWLWDMIERASANSDAVQGQTSPTANTTAFEVQQALVRAGVRFDIIYRRLKNQLEPMFEYIHMLALRFMPIEKEMQMMGEQAVVQLEDGSQMSRLQAIYLQEGKYGLTLSGNSITSEQMEAQKAEKLLQIAALPPYNSYISYKPESPYYLLYNLIKRLNPVSMDKILAKPEEVQQILRDRAQVQNEQEQKAVEEGKQQGNPEAQAQMQMMQAELQMKQAQLQMDMQKQEADMKMQEEKAQSEMRMKEQEHEQRMRQLEEAHKQKLENMRSESDAKAKAAAKAKPTSNT